MFGRISYTFSLMGSSWQVLKKDKEMLLFPLLSGICCLAVMASFAVPMFLTGYYEPPGDGAAAADQVAYYGLLFLFYVCNYFVIVFFNSALISCAVIRLSGGDPTVGDGMRSAFARIHLIFGWALVMATVGLILRIIEDRWKKAGPLIAGLLGMAWTLITYLAVPVLVVEGVGPVQAVKRSAQLLKRSWGEQLVGNFAFGIVFFLLGLVAVIPVALGFVSGSAVGVGIGIGVAALYLILLSLIHTALMGIFQAALYLYASEGKTSGEFDEGVLRGAMQ